MLKNIDQVAELILVPDLFACVDFMSEVVALVAFTTFHIDLSLCIEKLSNVFLGCVNDKRSSHTIFCVTQ